MAPVSLKPWTLLCMVGNVVKPEVIVNPVTPIDIGFDSLVIDPVLNNLPQETLPTGVLPVVPKPTTGESEWILQVIIPTF